jgi:molybdate transport system substrate-binding protein
MKLRILSGGAAQGVIASLAEKLKTETGCDIEGTFGAVGTIKEKFLAGAPCDLIILSAKLIGELAVGGHLEPGTVTDLGVVFTGVAVKKGDPPPSIHDAAAFKGSLLEARGIYFPDPENATAGIHFMRVIDRLGIRTEVASRLRPYPNGATAMREMAKTAGERVIGVTQITEISSTSGVTLVGPLPREFELATTYTLAVSARAVSPEAARRCAEILSSKESASLRRAAGFES